MAEGREEDWKVGGRRRPPRLMVTLTSCRLLGGRAG